MSENPSPSVGAPAGVKLPNRFTAFSEAFKAFIATDWAPYPDAGLAGLPATQWAPARRAKLQALFPGERLVLPAGPLSPRSNDCDYRFRPHSGFAHLSGLGTDLEPNAVLVIEAEPERTALYFHPRVPRTDPEFYTSPRYGEMWVGQRHSLAEMAALTGLTTLDSSQLKADLARPMADGGAPRIRLIRAADPALTAYVDALRETDAVGSDDEFEVACSELRLIKDDFEIAQLDAACAATKVGFDAVIGQLDEAVQRGKGERWVEGIFGLHARHLGNCIGYDSIVAGGEHACTLHWIRNDGDLKPGDLLLLDAGVEVDTLYTADVTRTLPVSGRFTPAQREVYEAVLAAQQAGIDAAQPGATFKDIHAAASRVIAERLEAWGILPVSAAESISEQGGQHRRWMVHGTSHHLGIDVHDCAQARTEHYREGTLAPGMVLTVEPGLYFKSTDLLVPERFRGIGVRIEDDLLVTPDGNRLLSGMFPRDPDSVEAWIEQVKRG